ncbi:MAG: dockerin type I domain-containing protein [Phycisphaerae bacterium]
MVVAGDIVINEVVITPTCGGDQYVEIENNGLVPVDTFTWWLCHQPSGLYFRLLQVPQGSGGPQSASIILQPGDYLVVRWGPSPQGHYTTRPNSAGTTTHAVNIFIPDFPTIRFNLAQGNVSLWDQSTPDTPTFDAVSLMTDFVAWGPGGIYVGPKRGCIANAAGLWSGPVAGACFDLDVQMPAVDSDLLGPGDNLSVAYNGGTANDPSDYDIFPSTEGEPSIFIGDVDTDGVISNADVLAMEGCLAQQPVMVGCLAADLNFDGTVDCLDWPRFLEVWDRLTVDAGQCPALSSCRTAGDFNLDNDSDLNDYQQFPACITGPQLGPADPACDAADSDFDQDVDLEDFARVQALLPGVFPIGDFDHSGVLDLGDFDRLICCYAGPGSTGGCGCLDTDLTDDNRVDLQDAALFMAAFSSP